MTKWLKVPLGELMVQRAKSIDPSKHIDETFNLYSIPAFENHRPDIQVGGSIGSSKQIVHPGDVLLSRIVPHIRRAWNVGCDEGRRSIASGEWIVFRSRRVDPDWLRNLLVSDVFHAEFMQTVAGVGGSLMRARPNQVANIQIPLPLLPEQRRIAAILDQADALRAKRREALAKHPELATSAFLDKFGEPSTNPKNWPRVSLGSMLESVDYGTSEKASTHGKYAVLRMNNITYGGALDLRDLKYMDLADNKVDRFTVRDGDILFNRTNSADLVGKTTVYRGDARMAYAGYLIRLRVSNGNDPEYISHFLNSRYGKNVLRNMCKSIVGMANINAREAQSITLPKPPTALQQEFSAFIRQLAVETERHKSALTELDALFASLQSRAFRGEL
jgi:type I restriction enzyme S subunit